MNEFSTCRYASMTSREVDRKFVLSPTCYSPNLIRDARNKLLTKHDIGEFYVEDTEICKICLSYESKETIEWTSKL